MKSLEEIRAIASECRFDLEGVKWKIEVKDDGAKWYVQVAVDGKCNVTGADLSWTSRKWLLSPHMTKTEIVRTCYLAVKRAVAHEVDERFTYMGKRIYDPHIDVDALAEVCERMDVREEQHVSAT